MAARARWRPAAATLVSVVVAAPPCPPIVCLLAWPDAPEQLFQHCLAVKILAFSPCVTAAVYNNNIQTFPFAPSRRVASCRRRTSVGCHHCGAGQLSHLAFAERSAPLSCDPGRAAPGRLGGDDDGDDDVLPSRGATVGAALRSIVRLAVQHHHDGVSLRRFLRNLRGAGDAWRRRQQRRPVHGGGARGLWRRGAAWRYLACVTVSFSLSIPL